MTVAVCSLGCDRKSNDGFPSWPYLFQLEGDYTLYCNYEGSTPDIMKCKALHLFSDLREKHPRTASFDYWTWNTFGGDSWRTRPKFDQDQARLASIVCARNMSIEYAMQTNASHLLFIDADIIPPADIISKMLEVGKDAVCGLVYGRGAHSANPYIFGEKRRYKQDGYQLIELEHGNIGFCMISRKLFEAVRFRYGTSVYPDGRISMTSDDPAFHLDCYIKFGEWPVLRMDVLGKHIGDLKSSEVSQF